MNSIWKTKQVKKWVIGASVIGSFMLVVGIVSTQVSLIYGTLSLVLGGYRYVAAEDTIKYYESIYDSKEESVAAGRALSEEVVSEGIVLLKNDLIGTSPALPLAAGSKVSVFGKGSVEMIYGGSGSGGRGTDSVINLYDALDDVGFDVNPTLKAFYDNDDESGDGRASVPAMGTILAGFAVGETPVSSYSSSITSSYENYDDAAIIVITRIAGEGYDLPRTMKTSWSNDAAVSGARSANDHYLQLDQNETDLIQHVANNDNFDNIIIVINSGSAMELGFLDDPTHYAYSDKISAALWMGNPGGTGNNALAKILAGTVNPSGRLPDTYARDFKQDPTWANFGNNLVEKGNEYFLRNWGTSAVNNGTYFVRYEEGIYVGYRYYETRGYTSSLGLQGDPVDWYEDHVVFPFGYGQSYTSFDWALQSQAPANGSAILEDDTLSVTVRVSNTGTVAGKDVVQLYYTAPYIAGGIEKSSVVLGGFAKTGIIQPGAHEDVTITLDVEAMASYDWNDANTNEFKGYELDAGTYQLHVSRNAHESELSVSYHLDEAVQFDSATNQFDDVSSHIATYLSRNNWVSTFPKSPVNADRSLSLNVLPNNATTREFLAPFTSHTVDEDYDADQPWETDVMPEYDVPSEMNLQDLLVESIDPVSLKKTYSASFDDPRWDEILNQLSLDELKTLVGLGAFRSESIETIRKPETQDFDGPSGFVIGSFMSAVGSDIEVTFFPAESLVAATWNVDLAKRIGEIVGDEGIWGGMKDGMQRTFSGWYAPAVNIHRSQFGGRNFEYYSEDGLLSGMLAANVIQGAQSNGTYTFVKHFALNEQETNRSDNGLATWANEQSMRELYFKPFELAVKVGETRGMMSSFNRIGSTWTGCSYPLLTEVLRNEWGFRGMVITDYNGPAYMNLDKMIRGGGDINLFQSIPSGSFTGEMDATQVSVLRNAAKNILYTVVNSNAMNSIASAKLMPLWELTMYITFASTTLVLAGWGYLAIKKAQKEIAAPSH